MGGGNLCTITHTLGTDWSFDGKGKIILLEDVGERGYKIDRMLDHLKNAGAFKGAKAIIFGEFSDGNEKNGASSVEFSLMRFALNNKIPVFKSNEFGHGDKNRPIMFNSNAKISKTSKKFELVVKNF
jgi:muramoyltetrapeptide carboxypeptidase